MLLRVDRRARFLVRSHGPGKAPQNTGVTRVAIGMKREFNRRTLLKLAGLVPPLLAPAWEAGSAHAHALAADDGSPVRNFALDETRTATALDQAQTVGIPSANLRILELFDYNCGYCRSAAGALDGLVSRDGRVQLVLVHHPILSPASLDAAAVQHAVFLRDGGERAYRLHQALMSVRGRVDGVRARTVCRDIGIDVCSEREEEAAAGQIAAMRDRARDLGLAFTPTFVLSGTAFVGWPGPKALEAMLTAARQCGQVACE